MNPSTARAKSTARYNLLIIFFTKIITLNKFSALDICMSKCKVERVFIQFFLMSNRRSGGLTTLKGSRKSDTLEKRNVYILKLNLASHILSNGTVQWSGITAE